MHNQPTRLKIVRIPLIYYILLIIKNIINQPINTLTIIKIVNSSVKVHQK
jgi:hypothetical protein